MEISADILSISGILVNARAKYGDLSKITYIKGLGGNEEIVNHVLESLRTFLGAKGCLEGDIPKPEFKNYYEGFCLFLIVNTEYSKTFNIEEYAHLTFNVPKISKYLLATTILNLNLTEHFCSAIIKIPLVYSNELFHEFLPCLDKLKQKQLIDDTYFLLNAIAQVIVLYEDLRHSDDMDSLLRTVPEYFMRFSCVSAEKIQKMKKNTLFKYAGNVLNGLFKLLVFCYKNKVSGVFIDQLIIATMTVVQGVSLDMFIYWAEIDLESGNTLQNEISETAYNIMEMYQQFKPASKLVDILKPFATKPKDIKEQIRMADSDKLVFMVNKNDNNQRQWFEALVFSQFFTNENAIKCVDKWHYLCKPEDVSRILNLSINNSSIKQLAIKCATILNAQDLIEVVTRHFYKNGFIVLNDTQAELVIFFNKLEQSESLQHVELILLILQDPENSIMFILRECLKNVFYVNVLEGCFLSLKDVLKVHDIAVNSLFKIIDSNQVTIENSSNYAKVFQLFLNVDLLTNYSLIMKINLLISQQLKGNTDRLLGLIKLLNHLDVSIVVNEEIIPFLQNLLKILSLRTKFMDHSVYYKDLLRETIILIHKLKTSNNDVSVLVENPDDEKFLSFYKKLMRYPDVNYTLLQHFFEDYNMENPTKNVCHLMQILPACVTEEWVSICSQIAQKTNSRHLMSVIKDMMILLCEFTESQGQSDVYPTLLEALKYCIDHVGIVVQNVVLGSSSTLEDEINVTEALIDFLCYIPESIKETVGLNLIKLMTVRSLKTNRENKVFVNKILKIRNKDLCQIVARTILE